MSNIAEEENTSAINAKLSTDCPEQEETTDSSYNLMIYGVKKHISCMKLKCHIEHAFGQIFDLKIIPYIDWNIAQVACRSKETYHCLLDFETEHFAEISHHFKFSPNAVSPCRPQVTEIPVRDTLIFQQLNYDCWRQIVQACTLKTQIQLAKVSYTFLDIIGDIWLRRYRNDFSYDLYDFEFKHELTAEDLQDFLIVCGAFVEKLYFNTIFYFPLIQRHFAGSGNFMKNAKKYINSNFCKHLPHLNNLKAIEVQGKFLADFALKEVARYCKSLRLLKLLDPDTRWFTGKYVHLLNNLNVLSLKDCENLSSKHMLRICSSLRNLRTLNIRNCKHLQNVDFILKMCQRTQCLERLKMSAIANGAALDAILQLPRLKALQMFWLNTFAEFEILFLAKLLQHQSSQLLTLSFDNDRLNVENNSKAPLSPHKYALMRENTTINGCAWNLKLAPTETETLAAFSHFTALRELSCIYCRPLSPQLLLDLTQTCSNLKLIKLIGCRAESDEKLLHSLQLLKMHSSGEVTACDICIEGLIPLTVLQHIRQRVLTSPYRTERNRPSVMRSILCEFNEIL